MNSQFSKFENKTDVSISVVTICDIRVLVRKLGDKYCFPSKLFNPQKETVQETASGLVEIITGENVSNDQWVPIDIRSSPNRTNYITNKFSLDIGFMSITDFNDIPIVDPPYSWVLIDFESGKFPLSLIEDHNQLWDASISMFNLLFR